MSQQDDASVREWTDILGRVRFSSLPAQARRKRSALTINAVAGKLAGFADPDGSRIFPSLVRLAVVLEIEYETAKDCMAVLREVGLIRVVRAGRGPGRSNQYQLTIPLDLADRLEVWSPSKLDAFVERISAKKRGRYRGPTSSSKTDLRGPTTPADTSGTPEPAGSDEPRSPADGTDLRGLSDPADTSGTPEPAGRITPPMDTPAGRIVRDLRGPDTPATHQRPEHNTYPPADDEDVRTAVTGPGARAAAAAPDPPPTPDRCTHRLSAARRPDGQPACVLCRRGLPPSDRAIARLPNRRLTAVPPRPSELAAVVPIRRSA